MLPHERFLVAVLVLGALRGVARDGGCRGASPGTQGLAAAWLRLVLGPQVAGALLQRSHILGRRGGRQARPEVEGQQQLEAAVHLGEAAPHLLFRLCTERDAAGRSRSRPPHPGGLSESPESSSQREDMATPQAVSARHHCALPAGTPPPGKGRRQQGQCRASRRGLARASQAQRCRAEAQTSVTSWMHAPSPL